MSVVIIRSWIARILLSITLIITFRIIRQNIKNRNYAKQQNKLILPKYLNVWSSMTLITSFVGIFIYLLNRIPYICLYSSYFVVPALVLPKIFLGMFQISRLQICFSKHEIHSDFGYSQYSFISLYTFGVLQVLFHSVHPWFTVSIKMNQFKDGCAVEPKNKFYGLSTMFGLFLLISWDIVILLMYVIKIYQFKIRQIEQNQLDNKIYDRIKNIMMKIVLLTVIGNIVTILSVTAATFIMQLWYIYSIIGTIIIYIAFSIDFMTVAIVMFLMLEHNEKQYEKLIKILYCFCSKSLLLKSMENQLKQSNSNIIQMNDIRKNTINTITVAPNHSIMQFHETPIDLSQETQTDEE